MQASTICSAAFATSSIEPIRNALLCNYALGNHIVFLYVPPARREPPISVFSAMYTRRDRRERPTLSSANHREHLSLVYKALSISTKRTQSAGRRTQRSDSRQRWEENVELWASAIEVKKEEKKQM